jgi:hypothetical protein
MKLSEQQRLDLYIEQAYKADRDSNTKKWIECLWASRIVGKYEYGASLKLAARLNVEVDSVEDWAHAYKIFEELCQVYQYRAVTFAARRSPYIHYSHFRVLYEAKERYKLTIDQVFGYLMDVIQAEGDLSARALDTLLKKKHDNELDWTWYASNALKAINLTLQQPDIPDDVKEVLIPAYNKLGEL